MLAIKQWLPVIMIGDDGFSGFAVRDDGSINEDPNQTLLGADMGAAAGNVFAGLGAQGAEQSVLTGIAIAYTIHSPGTPPRTIRRWLYDQPGPSQRNEAFVENSFTEAMRFERAIILMAPTDSVILPCIIPDWQIQKMAVASERANGDTMVGMLEAIRDGDERAQRNHFERLQTIPGPLYSWQWLRRAWSPSKMAWHITSPQIAHQGLRLLPASDGTIDVGMGFDILCNTIGITAELNAANSAQLRIQQGTLDTWAETMAVGFDDHGIGANAARALYASDTPWRLIANAEALAQAELDKDLATLIRADLELGLAAIIPDGPAEGMWWRIDPRTGSCLGMTSGRGNALTEYIAKLQSIALRAYIRVQNKRGFNVTACIACWMKFVVTTFGGQLSTGPIGEKLIGKACNKVCDAAGFQGPP